MKKKKKQFVSPRIMLQLGYNRLAYNLKEYTILNQ